MFEMRRCWALCALACSYVKVARNATANPPTLAQRVSAAILSPPLFGSSAYSRYRCTQIKTLA